MNYWSVWVLVLAIGLQETSAAMTQAQVKTGIEDDEELMPTKSGISTETLNAVHEGQFPEDRDLKCYMKCVMGMTQSMKNGKITTDAAVAHLKRILPSDIRDRVTDAVEKCRHAAEGLTDTCDMAFAATKCTYDADPEVFLFP